MRPVLFIVIGILSVAVAHAQASSYEEVEVASGGSVAGRVTFAGTPPAPQQLEVGTDTEVCAQREHFSRTLIVGAEGGVRNAVLNLQSVPQGKKWKNEEYTLSQRHCRFEPHVLLLPESADLHITNTDRILHMVRSHAEDSVFSVGQPRFVEKLLVENFAEQVSHPRVVEVVCDIHQWMSAYIVVQKHPYYDLTDERGFFRLDDVPPGEYDLELWHETLGEKTQRVTVRPEAEASVTIEMGLPPGGSTP